MIRADLPPDLQHLSRGGLLGALDIDPTPIPQPDMSYAEVNDYLRLANYWPKIGEKAGQLNIDEGRKIREEDLRHDQ